MKHIFASQSTMRMSHSQQDIEKRLDIKTPIERFEALFNSGEKRREIKECPHKNYCSPTIQHYPMKCVYAQAMCKVKPFYDRYKEWYDNMGIGAVVIVK